MIPRFSTEPIELEVNAGQPVTIPHGLGRQVAGWAVIWCTAPVTFHVQDPAADTRTTLVLVPSATARVRLLLL